MNRYLPLLLFFLCLSFLSLPAQEAHSGANFATGNIIDTVLCTHTPGQSYALYLPKEYTPARTWPILYIFEPAARSHLALSVFQTAAEQMNWILACSNNSHNGPWEDILAAADAVLLDTQEKLSIDYEQLYTAGFSGGSRAAMSVAVITGRVVGVIGCGAVFPSVEEYMPGPEKASFRYVGMVGLKDMNYQEHLGARERLTEFGIDNHLILFEAGHEWPPSGKAVEAVQWLVLKQQVENQSPDKALLQNYSNSILAAADTFFQEQYPVLAVDVLEGFRTDFGVFVNTEAIDTRLRQATGDKAYRKQLKEREKVNKKEADLQQKYLSAFVELYWTITGSTMPPDQLEWWEVQINYLKKQTQKQDALKRNSAYRLLNLIAARSAESCFEMVSQENYPLATALNELWLIPNPEDVFANWHMARVHALMGHKGQALDYLERAVEYGMQYTRSLRAPEFEFLKEEKRYEQMVQVVTQREK